MDFDQKLPRNKGEFALFLAVISVLSVCIIAPLITCFELGFRPEIFRKSLSAIPLVWLSVIVLALLTYRPAQWMTRQIVAPEDSFAAHTLANILCTVLLMSIFLTVIGAWIGSQAITLDPIRLFFHKWPRNFAISFGVETCIAQPAARLVMKKLHQRQDGRSR